MKTMTMTVFAIVALAALSACAANVVTVQTVDAEPGDTLVRVDVCAANDVDLLEYFNLLFYDTSRLDFVDLVADRGGFWYGFYPTHVVGAHIYVHGWSDTYPDCIDPAGGDPGPPLYHMIFNVKPDAPEGLAGILFLNDSPFDGHWNDCSGNAVNPWPDYHEGGVQVKTVTDVGELRDRLTATARPNPATRSTQIDFSLPRTGNAEITVYDLTGRRIRTLMAGRMDAGPHAAHWDGTNEQGRPAPAGVYFCRVRSTTGVAVEKIMLVR